MTLFCFYTSVGVPVLPGIGLLAEIGGEIMYRVLCEACSRLEKRSCMRFSRLVSNSPGRKSDELFLPQLVCVTGEIKSSNGKACEALPNFLHVDLSQFFIPQRLFPSNPTRDGLLHSSARSRCSRRVYFFDTPPRKSIESTSQHLALFAAA